MAKNRLVGFLRPAVLGSGEVPPKLVARPAWMPYGVRLSPPAAHSAPFQNSTLLPMVPTGWGRLGAKSTELAKGSTSVPELADGIVSMVRERSLAADWESQFAEEVDHGVFRAKIGTDAGTELRR